MIRKIDHIGVAVQDLAEAKRFYGEVLGLEPEGEEEVPDQKVRVAFFRCGEVRIELLEPTSEDSPVAKAIAKRGPGVHHIAYRTDDVAANLEELAGKGVRLVDRAPRPGAHGKQIAFLHPKSTFGVLTELTQVPGGAEGDS